TEPATTTAKSPAASKLRNITQLLPESPVPTRRTPLDGTSSRRMKGRPMRPRRLSPLTLSVHDFAARPRLPLNGNLRGPRCFDRPPTEIQRSQRVAKATVRWSGLMRGADGRGEGFSRLTAVAVSTCVLSVVRDVAGGQLGVEQSLALVFLPFQLSH